MFIVIHNETGTRAQQSIISEDTTWTLANSPYIITGNVLVEHGVSLTIEPGVEVKFDGYYYMQIEGKLVTEGTENDMITFTSNKDSPSPRDWRSIKFMGNADNGSSFKYCNIEYGYDAVSLEGVNPYAAPNITHCNINNNSQMGIKYFTSSPDLSTIGPINEISNNTITDNGDCGIQIQLDVQIENAGLIVSHNVIENNDGSGIVFNVYEGNLTIVHNIILNNDGCGMLCNGVNVYVLNNLILYNDGNGVSIVGSEFNSMVIEHNTVINNRDVNDKNGGGINFEQHEETTSIILRYNNIYNNTPYDARNSREIDRDISYNWWGTTESEIIEQHIHDYYDDFRRGKFNYTPFLTESDPDAPDPSAYMDGPSDPPTTPIDTAYIIVPIFLVMIVIIIVVVGIVIFISKRT